jgi:hypothetical protein
VAGRQDGKVARRLLTIEPSSRLALLPSCRLAVLPFCQFIKNAQKAFYIQWRGMNALEIFNPMVKKKFLP